jgi:hypothetical protein
MSLTGTSTRSEIVLIGPCAAGKSTLAMKLASNLGINLFQVDLLRWYYFYKNGYNLVLGLQLIEKESVDELAAYWKPFELLTLENVVNDFRDGIFDFGGTYSFYEDPAMLHRAKIALKDFRHVFLILPCRNKEASLNIVNGRVRKQCEHYGISREQVDSRLEMNRKMIYGASNSELCTHRFFYDDKTADDLAVEIIAHLSNHS